MSLLSEFLFWDDPQRHAGMFGDDFGDRSIGVSDQGGQVSGVGERDLSGGGVDHGQCAGDEAVSESAGGDISIEVLECDAEVGLIEQVVACGRVESCHQQCGGDPLASDVGDGDSDLFSGQFDVVEVVASDPMSRFVVVAELESVSLRSFVGQEPELNLGGEVEFTFEVALFEYFGVERGVFDRESALGGDSDQHIEVTFFERQGHVMAGQLDQSQCLAVESHQRSAHH